MKTIGIRKQSVGSSGFSLIEAVAAISLTGILLVSALMISSQANLSTVRREKSSDAFNFMHDMSETLLFVSNPDDGILTAGTHEKIFNGLGQEDPNGKYKVRWVIEENVPMSGIMKISLTTEWQMMETTKTDGIILYRSMLAQTRRTGDQRVPARW